MAHVHAKGEPPLLRDATKGRGTLIIDDKSCVGCGYNLKGLNADSSCPECGRPIVNRGSRLEEPHLVDAPFSYVATLALALLVAAFAGVINFFNAVPLTHFLSQSSGGMPWTLHALHIAGAVVWLVAILITLRPRPLKPVGQAHGEKPQIVEWRRLRRACLLTQCVWPAVAVLRYMQFATTSAVFGWIAYGLVIIGVAGWALVAVHTSFLADWARDDAVAGRLRAAAWGFAFLGLGLLAVIHVGTLDMGWTNVLFLFSGVIVIGWLASYVMFIQGMMQLGFGAQWSIANARAQAERDLRRAERTQRETEKRLAEEMAWDPPFQPDPALLASIEAAQTPYEEPANNSTPHIPDGPLPGSSTQRIQRQDGVEPYKLEGDA